MPEQDTIHFAEDIYHHDSRLDRALATRARGVDSGRLQRDAVVLMTAAYAGSAELLKARFYRHAR